MVYKDLVGNTSSPVSSGTIILDTVAPTLPTISINNSAVITNNVNATLTLSAVGADSMKFSGDIVGGNVYVLNNDSANVMLTGGDGTKNVSVIYKDLAGNTSSPTSDGILLDATAPTSPTIVINSGAALTNNVNVTLTLNASGADSMKITGDVTAGSNVNKYIAFSTSSNVTLTSGNGTKTVNVVYKDVAGNISNSVSDNITLDTTVPSITTAVYQNPALSKYLDIVVVSLVNLSQPPTVKMWRTTTTDTTPVTMALILGAQRAYKGSAEFDTSGTYKISAKAIGSNGLDTIKVHTYNVTFAKPGQTTKLLAINGKAQLEISGNSINEPTYFLSEYWQEKGENIYRFGPEKQFSQPLSLELSYEPGAYMDPGKLFIFHKEDGEWKPLRSQVFTNQNTVRARVNNLGEFKLVYDESFEGTNLVPTTFALKQNYPNPFNPTTTIAYDLPEDGQLVITIYNLLGQQIKTLQEGYQLAGSYATQWDGKNEVRQTVASGIYFYRIQSGRLVQTRKMLLLR